MVRSTRGRGKNKQPLSSSCSQEPNNKLPADVSFMDTEPLGDYSVLDTEPMELDLLPGVDDETTSEEESEEEGQEEGVDTDSQDDDEDRGGDNDNVSLLDPFDDSIDEDDLNISSPPPPIDITMSESYEIKRIYSDLIDSCRGFDNQTLYDGGDRILKTNIYTGDALCKQMGISLSQSLSESQSNATRRPLLGNSVSELLLACQHTKVFSVMLNQAVKNLGVVACVFKLDEFMHSLKASSEDQIGGYSVLSAVRKLAFTASCVSKSVACFRTLAGSIEKENLIQGMEPPTPKPEKVRITRKKNEVNKEEDATQKEVMNATTQKDSEDQKKGTSEGLAIELLKSIKNKETPQNMLEVAYADTVSNVVSRLMGVAFVVRDGHVELHRGPAHGSAVDTDAVLMLKPAEKPPVKVKSNDDKNRSQCIVSFSARFLKEIVKEGQVDED